VPDWKEMVTQLVTGHEIAAATSRDVIKAADTAGDEDKADMVTGRLKDHEKTAWMLRSLLK
jgi:starvation-inducible DNA-binding protein